MRRVCTLLFLTFAFVLNAQVNHHSIYESKIEDKHAVYFIAENFGVTADGKSDVSTALQNVIDDLKRKDNFGIVFIPEGKYKITKTIYIPKAIRLIGYGENRPEFILADRSTNCRFMFWFTSDIVTDETRISDANAGTFYSALTNINLRIGKGNSQAIALRTHFAQHSFISNCDIYINSGKAGIYDVGNEIENVAFYGGDYGIYTHKTSPSWQFTMLNTHFENQRKAAIYTEEGGWVIKRANFKNMPMAIEIAPDRHDKIYIGDSNFQNIGTVLLSNFSNLAPNQLVIRNSNCTNVPFLVRFRSEEKDITAPNNSYVVKEFAHGLQKDSMDDIEKYNTVCEFESGHIDNFFNDIPQLPKVDNWVNVKNLGAIGDGIEDDTQIIMDAISKYDILYFPQGNYKVSHTIKLNKNTVLIGLNPISTQLVLQESSPEFSGFGAPVALLETSEGGQNIINGIGINTGAFNYRAVGCKWMAGEYSYMNDVKFLGGHGTMFRTQKNVNNEGTKISTPEKPVYHKGKDKAWDNQHWSLWITNNGGGTFKDIWSADTYATSGVFINNTTTPGRIYEMSVEHHVRNEVTIKNVNNWEFYALQLEEENRESPDVQQIEIQNCNNLLFANLYLFRVIWIDTPLPYAIRLWGHCNDIEFYNVHNFTQMRMTTNLTVYDVNKNIDVRSWELNRLSIKGNEKKTLLEENGVKRLVGGLEHVEGLCRDNKGNIFFSEQRMKRIYKYDPQLDEATVICDLPWQILSLGCDTEDNILACVKYYAQPGYSEEIIEKADRIGTTFSWWGNSGFETKCFSINPNNPEETFYEMPRLKYSSVCSISRAFYPAHRWRDLHDFEEVSKSKPEYCFLAPDGKTVIPDFYDLVRSSSLTQADIEEVFYTCDEYNHQTVSMKLDSKGNVRDFNVFISYGDHAGIVGPDGNIYILDGNIYVFSRDGKLEKALTIPERPTSIIFAGQDNARLFVTAGTSVYEIMLK